MIADLMRYPEYKESGLPWLGRMPAHWETRRLRNACEMRVSNVDKHTKHGEIPIRLCNYVEVYRNERIRASTRFMQASATEDERIRFGLRRGDVLITKDSEQWNDIGIPALVEFEAPDLICGYHLAILRSRHGLQGGFLLRAIQCHLIAAQFHVEANGVTRYGLSHGAIQGVAIPLPPPTEQAAIVRFLDWASGRLERAIRAKRKVIALLNEQKQAIIHRAVTRGLDPSVPLKPSGIPWLGDIPQHWEVSRLGHSIRIQTGFPFSSAGFVQSETGTRLLRGINITPSGVRWNEIVRWQRKPGDGLDGFALTIGDIVLGMDRPIIASGVRATTVEENDTPSLLLQRVARLRTTERLEAGFLLLLLRGQLFRTYIAPIFSGISVPHFSPEQIKGFKVPLPPYVEQRNILEQLEAETSAVDTAVSRLEREVGLLREYRTRLVADVVTGKLDVREAAARLPHEVESGADKEEIDVEDEEQLAELEIG